MRARRTLTAAIYTVLAVILLATVIVAVLGLKDGDLKPIDLWASLVPTVLAVVAAVLGALQAERQPSDSLDQAVRLQASALAWKVTQDWRAESRHRGLYTERRMAVRWRREPGSDRFTRLAADLPEEGVLDQLTGAFSRHVRAGNLSRLVVTGEPGAGKTAVCVLLTLELAGQEPVIPVLFQLSSWDPARPLAEWMTDELTANYPALADETRGREVAAELVRHQILPVLDGLDEVADPAAALRGIEDGLVGRSFVLTCRTREYAALGPDRRLGEAVEVRLQPLSAGESRGVLQAAGPGFQPLITALDAEPGGPLARALRTPFMLSLAVAVDGSLPGELLSATAPDTEERIRQQLLGTFVRRAYPRTSGNGIDAADARRYLAFLARHVDPGTGRLAWWQLHRAVPRPVFLGLALVNAGIACSAAAAALFSLFNRFWLGLGIGLGAAVVGAFVVELVPQDDPRRAKPRLRSVHPTSPYAMQRVLGFGAVGGAACAVIVRFLYEKPQYIAIGGVLSGITFAAARYFSEPSDPMDAVTPGNLLRSDRSAVLYALLTGAVAGALTGGYLGASIKDGRRTPQLDDVTLIGRLPSAVEALLGAAGGALLSATGLGLMAFGSSSWGRFVITRGWLALRGRTPRRLMAFVEDARERGVLRQANGYYEFRHRLLQHHLAEPVRAVASAPDTSTGPDSTQYARRAGRGPVPGSGT
ncbi:NACHT domain-containing protein [Streptomyces sp. CA-111067]|uniref:NACHT domain-containing protein n=1 Tax=Streptomyces sp. CA-111067 TaxID=3240046 RepID=UPI003D97C307